MVEHKADAELPIHIETVQVLSCLVIEIFEDIRTLRVCVAVAARLNFFVPKYGDGEQKTGVGGNGNLGGGYLEAIE